MTRVALYARYSSENQKESSIVDQFRNCEQRAAREGWTMTARYDDKAISGAITDHPGYQQMLTDAKAKRFDVLLVDDFSRLSRDSVEAEQARRRLVHWGLRVIGVTDGIDAADKGHKMLAGFKGIMNEQYLTDLRDKITRGMTGQALKGFHCGGRVYGHKLVPVADPVRKDCYGQPAKIGTRLEIDPDQARWVTQIFQWFADGWWPIKIVNELNRLHVPAPGVSSWRKVPRTPVWSTAALHGELRRGTGLLNNPLYTGLYCWNRSRREKDPDTQTESHRWRPEQEWVKTPMPHLRLISDDLWTRVTARRRAVSAGVLALRARHSRARSTGRGPKYLFSGLLVCGVCGARFTIRDVNCYGCSTCFTKGRSQCANSIKVSRALIESLLLQPIQRDLFTEEGFTVYRDEVVRELAALRKAKTPTVTQAQAQLKRVEQEIENIMVAIKAGILTPSTKSALEQAERERERLRHTIQGQKNGPDQLSTLLPTLLSRFQRVLDEMAVVSQHEVDKARGILRALVGGSIVLHPTSDGRERFLTAELSGDYAGLVRLVVGPKIILVEGSLYTRR